MAKRPKLREFDVPRCVAPDGSIVHAAGLSGLSVWIGGRGGPLHRDDGSLRPQRWVSERWDYRHNPEASADNVAQSRPLDGAHPDFSLSFLDEATALAAGHRPCEVHQLNEARRFLRCWSTAHGAQTDDWADIDRTLHVERLDEQGRKNTHKLSLQDLPDGGMFRARVGSYLCLGGRCFLWSTRGYAAEAPFEADDVVESLTPKAILGVLGAGYEPDIHESILKFL